MKNIITKIVNYFSFFFIWGLWIFASINGGQYAFIIVFPALLIFIAFNLFSIKDKIILSASIFSLFFMIADVYYANIKANDFVKNKILIDPCKYSFNDGLWEKFNSYQIIHTEYGILAMKHILVTRETGVDYGYMDSRWFSIHTLCKSK